MTFQQQVERITISKKKFKSWLVIPITIVLVAVVMFGGVRLREFLSMGATAASSTTVKPTNEFDLALQGVETAKATYEQRGDIASFTAYGQALEHLTAVTQDYRGELQKKFYHQLAIEAGRKYNIHWSMLYALWMRESKMNPDAKGDGKPDNQGVFIPGTWRAFGLGQIHLPTAQTHYDAAITKEQLMDPVTNGMASAKVLRDYMDMFKGDPIWGISAYQQGPAPAQIQYKAGLPPKNFVKYVQEVIRLQQEALQTWAN